MRWIYSHAANPRRPAPRRPMTDTLTTPAPELELILGEDEGAEAVEVAMLDATLIEEAAAAELALLEKELAALVALLMAEPSELATLLATLLAELEAAPVLVAATATGFEKPPSSLA